MEISERHGAISSMLDEFVDKIRNRDPALIDRLWGDGNFILVGSEPNETCRTRAELSEKLNLVFAQPSQLVFDFPDRLIRSAGTVAWLFSDGLLKSVSPDGTIHIRPYRVSCIFEFAGGLWCWRQFFGSEPANPVSAG